MISKLDTSLQPDGLLGIIMRVGLSQQDSNLAEWKGGYCPEANMAPGPAQVSMLPGFSKDRRWCEDEDTQRIMAAITVNNWRAKAVAGAGALPLLQCFFLLQRLFDISDILDD
ncbi:hypothetical protein E6O75_ATG04485 [Venturia nashicola]|uniref:Uncharacterized protein n=1 Tax=Venturia nashicola TaxID=86259 RepID=A0A4Z1PNH7_9PEZI|nr:hypothetical protein E6O75_ATG04485 [Venturia nashicola]